MANRSTVRMIAGLLSGSVLLFLVSGASAQNEQFRSLEKDFQPGQAQRAPFNDFSLKFQSKNLTAAGELIANTVAQNALLGVMPGNGIAQVLVTLGPCSINQPHVHPRGTEAAFVLEGEIFFGLQEENGARFIAQNVTAGNSFVIPTGLFHFVQNLGCEPVKFLASFDNRDPGTITFASSFFKFDNAAIRATLQLSDDDFAAVQQAAIAATNPSQDPVCLARCGLAGSYAQQGGKKLLGRMGGL